MFRSINGGFPIVKYLVEQRNFTFNEACIIYSQMCEKCANHCLYELGDLQHKVNYNNIKMLCEHCETIDPEHYYCQRTMACYRALKNGDDIEKTFNEYSKHTRWRE